MVTVAFQRVNHARRVEFGSNNIDFAEIIFYLVVFESKISVVGDARTFGFNVNSFESFQEIAILTLFVITFISRDVQYYIFRASKLCKI